MKGGRSSSKKAVLLNVIALYVPSKAFVSWQDLKAVRYVTPSKESRANNRTCLMLYLGQAVSALNDQF